MFNISTSQKKKERGGMLSSKTVFFLSLRGGCAAGCKISAEDLRGCSPGGPLHERRAGPAVVVAKDFVESTTPWVSIQGQRDQTWQNKAVSFGCFFLVVSSCRRSRAPGENAISFVCWMVFLQWISAAAVVVVGFDKRDMGLSLGGEVVGCILVMFGGFAN